MIYAEEVPREQRQRMRGLFKRREMRNLITRKTVIRMYIELAYKERYPLGIPHNLIRLDKLYINTI